MLENRQAKEHKKIPKSRKPKKFLQGILVIGWLFFGIDLLWPMLSPLLGIQPAPNSPPPTGTNYLIIAPEGLTASAHEWEAYRKSSGYQAKTIILSAIDARSPAYIREIVLDTYRSSETPYPFFLLIIGHAHADSPNQGTYIAPARITLPRSVTIITSIERAYPECKTSIDCKTIPGDDGFVIDNDQNFLPIAVGRIPAQSNDEALAILERTKNYERNPPQGEDLTHIELLASESGWGTDFNGLMESGLKVLFSQFLPPEYQLHFLYGDSASEFNFPAEQFRDEALRRFDTNPTFLFYAGHGFHNQMAPVLTASRKQLPVFTTQDASSISHAERTIAFTLACFLGAYDFPTEMGPSLAEALILSPKGPVGVYSASRVSFAIDNLLLGEEMLWRKTHLKEQTLGELLRHVESSYQFPAPDTSFALWAGKSIFTPLYQQDARQTLLNYDNQQDFPPGQIAIWQRYEYNLFGDPALKLPLPGREIKFDISTGQISWDTEIDFSGSVPLPPGTNVAISLAIPPDRNAPQELSPKKDISVYENVNQRQAARVYVPVDKQGRFSGKIKFPAALPDGKYYLLAVATDGQTTQTGYQSIYYRSLPYDAVSISWWGFILTSIILFKNHRATH